jgi:mannose-6-phosphate isomerase
VELLRGAIRPYAWGSRTAIAALQGRPMPSDQPEAELWLGAHPGDPALLADDRPLTEFIDTDPTGVLGEATIAEFGQRLPFMLKVLAAEEPLSMQAHPDAEQAAEGFARENAEGVARDSAHRSYVDAQHKPELLCAVSEFETLCGFRDPHRSAEVIDRLDVPGLAAVVAMLRHDDAAQGLREAVTYLLTLTDEHRADLVQQTITAAAALTDPGQPDAGDYAMVIDLGKRYPHDAGTIVALLLNHVYLRPGQAIYMPAGNLHAYLRGVGVEILAASDNVLRGGLTPKHIDVPELLRVLRFEVLDDPISPAVQTAPGVTQWPVPVPDFQLSKVQLDAAAAQRPLDTTGPTVVLCWSGQVRLDDGIQPVTLRPGQAAFARADTPNIYISGFGELYCASPGLGH